MSLTKAAKVPQEKLERDDYWLRGSEKLLSEFFLGILLRNGIRAYMIIGCFA